MPLRAVRVDGPQAARAGQRRVVRGVLQLPAQPEPGEVHPRVQVRAIEVFFPYFNFLGDILGGHFWGVSAQPEPREVHPRVQVWQRVALLFHFVLRVQGL